MLVRVRVGAGEGEGDAVGRLSADPNDFDVPGLGEDVGVPLGGTGVGVSCKVHDIGSDTSGSGVAV